MFERKHMVAATIAVGCLISFGGWLTVQTQSPQVVLAPNATTANFKKSVHEMQASEAARPSESRIPASGGMTATPQLPSGNDVPGTLNDQIERALAEKDGSMAVNLANKLRDCGINMMILTVESSKGAPTDADSALLEIRKERLQRYEQMNASCQTVVGDQHQIRMRLLELAIHQNVVGAATESFEAGSRDPGTLSHVVSDASAGDIKALTTLAMYDIRVFGATRDDQDAARYALKLASNDPVVGERVINYLKVAESYGAPNSDFDLSDISAAARSRGAATAEKARERLAKTTP